MAGSSSGGGAYFVPEPDAEDDADEDGADGSATAFPFATVAKLVKEVMPPDMKAAADVAPLVQSYLSAFVQLLAKQANEKAIAEKKNTLTEAHLRTALDELGFAHYAPSLPPADDGAEDGAPARKKQKKKRATLPPGMTEEESLRLQQELFASARELQSGQSASAEHAT